MSSTPAHKRVDHIAPAERAASEHHVRGDTDVPTQFVENVSKVGIVQPPLVREEDGKLRVLDGMRRLAAAEQAGMESVAVIVLDVDGSEAAELSLSANLGVWRKPPTDRDETAALNALAGGPRRVPHDAKLGEWEQVESAKYALGMVTEVERVERALDDVRGVGEAVSQSLVDEFGALDDVREASEADLGVVDGIGQTLSSRISDALERGDDEVEVTTQVVSDT